MSKITGVVIAKNEEEMIEECLSSLSFCDQVIVVDTGSTDQTISIASRKGAKVYTFAGDNFAAIREFAASKVRTTWLFYLDADERVTKELAEQIRAQIDDSKQKINAFRVKRKNYYFGNHPWPTVERLERVFKRSSLKGWQGELHETAVVEGEIGDVDGVIKHFTHRDFSSMVEKTNKWSEKEARLRLKADHPPITWWRFPRVMATAWYDSYIKQRGFKAGTVGILESVYQMFSIFVTYAKLWELQQKKKT